MKTEETAIKEYTYKAQELINKYLSLLYGKKQFYKKSDYFKAKKCALICVKDHMKYSNGICYYEGKGNCKCCKGTKGYGFWEEVEDEIKKYII